MNAFLRHLCWIGPLLFAVSASDNSAKPDSDPEIPLALMCLFAIAGWFAVLKTWRDPKSFAQLAALFAFPVGVALYLLVDSKGFKAFGLGLSLWGAIPFFIWLAANNSRGGPNVDGRGNDGDGGGA